MRKLFVCLIILSLFACSSIVAVRPHSRGTRPPKIEKYICQPADREGEYCPEYYHPVCGNRPDLKCEDFDCQYMTYDNECFACHDPDVRSFSEGECAHPY